MAVGLLLLLLVAALIAGGVGFAIHLFWIIAGVLFVAWLVLTAIGSSRRSRTGSGASPH
jgi:hypothetical protein